MLHHYKIRTSIDGKMVTLDHLGEEELKMLSKEESYPYETLEITRNDGKCIEYYKIDGIYQISNKLNRKGF